MTTDQQPDYAAITADLKAYAQSLGFQQLGVTDIKLGEHPDYLAKWLERGYHGEMHYMARHADLRSKPDQLVPGTIRLLSARMNYLAKPSDAIKLLDDGKTAYISRYALGRDYHKVLRKKLAKVAAKLQEALPNAKARAFTDSAPVLEKAVAEKAGLGWIGKNTLLLNRSAGSWFFLGEIFTDAKLQIDINVASGNQDLCGNCTACITACPTGAIIGPRQLDSKRCISYLTIEHKGDIPESLRAPMGNRIFGCDDCQLVCPWTQFATATEIADFKPRSPFADGQLLSFWAWSEEKWLTATEGMAIRRMNYEQWRRNLAVALGNAKPSAAVVQALEEALATASNQVQRHIHWALERQASALSGAGVASPPAGASRLKKWRL